MYISDIERYISKQGQMLRLQPCGGGWYTYPELGYRKYIFSFFLNEFLVIFFKKCDFFGYHASQKQSKALYPSSAYAYVYK